MKNNTQRECRYCQSPIRGRIDKKFCCDLCRARYHNENERESRITRTNAVVKEDCSFEILMERLEKEQKFAMKQKMFTKSHALGLALDFCKEMIPVYKKEIGKAWYAGQNDGISHQTPIGKSPEKKYIEQNYNI